MDDWPKRQPPLANTVDQYRLKHLDERDHPACMGGIERAKARKFS